MNDLEQAVSALHCIPADDRDIWWRMGAALKSAFGNSSFPIWDSWSRQSQSYDAKTAQSQWRTFRPGVIGIGSLYHEAKQWGWKGNEPVKKRPSAKEQREIEAAQRRDAQRRKHLQRAASNNAQHMLDLAELSQHPYLAAKGFPEAVSLVLNTKLLIPMRNARTGALQSVQEIDAEGNKKFLAGGRAQDAVFRVGSGVNSIWYCEGYATALSIREALKRLYRRDMVVVCFSAHNLARVARRGYVVADHDASGTGEKYAKQTGLPYWMPPVEGFDANDFMLAHGTRALADELRELL